jgi:ankyrin repeat protein
MTQHKVDLPARPSMEWLRKAARQHLATLRVAEPEARLTDAQLAVARRHGFSSWRRLKAYVDVVNGDADRLAGAVVAGDLTVAADVLYRWPRLVDVTDEPDDPTRPSDSNGMRLLHLAVAHDKPEMVRLLLARGADANMRNAHGRLPLHDCFELNRDDIADILFGAGVEPDVCAAVCYGTYDKLLTILATEPAQANDVRTGLSPLGWAGFAGDVRAAQILLEHGAIVDRPPYDMHAWGPACQVARVEMARVLLAAGADPNAQDTAGETPLHRVLASRLVGDPSEFVALLLDHGADPHRSNLAGLNAIDTARAQVGRDTETYFPRRSLGAKQLGRTVDLLEAAVRRL